MVSLLDICIFHFLYNRIIDMSFVSSSVISLQEFHALKKRCGKQFGEKYTCFVAVWE
jgi:hypothetical protein